MGLTREELAALKAAVDRVPDATGIMFDRVKLHELIAQAAAAIEYREALEEIAKGIHGRRQEGGDPMETDWQIARRALAAHAAPPGSK